jgi:hypothetical protein
VNYFTIHSTRHHGHERNVSVWSKRSHFFESYRNLLLWALRTICATGMQIAQSCASILVWPRIALQIKKKLLWFLKILEYRDVYKCYYISSMFWKWRYCYSLTFSSTAGSILNAKLYTKRNKNLAMFDRWSFVSLRIRKWQKHRIAALATSELQDLRFLLVELLKIRALCDVTSYRLVNLYWSVCGTASASRKGQRNASKIM